MTALDNKLAKNRIADAKTRIIPIHEDGHTVNQIAKKLNLTRETVQSVIRGGK